MPTNKNYGIFKNSGAILTKDGYIILAHASQANFNTEECYSDYLIQHLTDVGIKQMASELKTTPEKMIADLIKKIGERQCQKIVKKRFTKSVL